MEEVLAETESMLARGRMDLPLTLRFAVVRGDDLLLHQLLKRGLDPNESDNNGRTALVCSFFPIFFVSLHMIQLIKFSFGSIHNQHIAASNGSENSVLLLLDYEADPNCRGML